MAGARNGPKAVIRQNLTPNSAITSYTCEDSLALSRGTIVEIRDPFTVSMANAFTGANSVSGAYAGIVARDKEAGDASTQVAVYDECYADVRASGAITAGDAVYLAGNDEVRILPVTMNGLASNAVGVALIGGMKAGIAQETATDGEVILVRFLK